MKGKWKRSYPDDLVYKIGNRIVGLVCPYEGGYQARTAHEMSTHERQRDAKRWVEEQLKEDK